MNTKCGVRNEDETTAWTQLIINQLNLLLKTMQKNEMQGIVDSLAQTRRSHFEIIEKMTLNDIKELVRDVNMILVVKEIPST